MPETKDYSFVFWKYYLCLPLNGLWRDCKVNFILAKFAKFDEYRGIQYKPIFLRFKKKN